ncbi:MAG: GerMN domain-containing protein [Candidatus Pacearchaeota archaeon]|nr:GerMN domain-containing protein [Candidatus Pacearchaeota archaeon]
MKNILFVSLIALAVVVGVGLYVWSQQDREDRSQEGRLVKLYYYNQEKDKDETGNLLCSQNGLVAVEREIPLTQTPIQDTIRTLLLGELSELEREQGIETEYPLEGFSLKGASLRDGVLSLEFEDVNNRTVGGSCRVGILWFQIEATAKQFEEVSQVRFLPEELFQP